MLCVGCVLDYARDCLSHKLSSPRNSWYALLRRVMYLTRHHQDPGTPGGEEAVEAVRRSADPNLALLSDK
ncbi:hypothetical protein E2C01_095338 [Portunus trituberculatus]|uniref:Uncharacterized protein n=1 Tax=Portunus trituberculatus TaxID=210409 RepID=A0A5B7JZW4_PORTR|nr:hypothetical protein [Portunus trituberculatus]